MRTKQQIEADIQAWCEKNGFEFSNIHYVSKESENKPLKITLIYEIYSGKLYGVEAINSFNECKENPAGIPTDIAKLLIEGEEAK